MSPGGSFPAPLISAAGDDELTATLQTVTAGFGCATVRFRNGFDERQADTKSLRVERSVADLNVRIEHPRHDIWRNANSLIANPHDRSFSVPFTAHPDHAAIPHVLRGIVQEVREHLHDPGRIRVKHQRQRLTAERQSMLAPLNLALTRLDGLRNQRCQLDRPSPQSQLAERQSPGIEQIVDQMGQLQRQRISQLVTQPGEEG